MIHIHYASQDDLAFWSQMDPYISEHELLIKIANQRCYVLKEHSTPVGVMRYNLFWDSIPFLTMIYFKESARGKGYGTQALQYWENKMSVQGFPCVMTSTQSDEKAQFFYRKLGYQDAGCLIINITVLAQPSELLFIKELQKSPTIE